MGSSAMDMFCRDSLSFVIGIVGSAMNAWVCQTVALVTGNVKSIAINMWVCQTVVFTDRECGIFCN